MWFPFPTALMMESPLFPQLRTKYIRHYPQLDGKAGRYQPIPGLRLRETQSF